MAKTQMAFDFGDLPQKPLPENIFVAEEKIIPAEEKIASVEVAIVAPEEKMITSSEEEVVQTETVIPEKKATVAKPVENNNAPKEKSTRGRKSIKEMSAGVELIEVPEDAILFQKMYYTIGKVAEMFKVNQSLIRLWENEFDVLKPKKNGKGDRLFRPEDIKNIHLIYHLMRERKYTMEGAKEFIKNNKRANEKFVTIESLKKLKGFLVELKANL
jgi:DNA-binding transcriptional MerR regulator